VPNIFYAHISEHDQAGGQNNSKSRATYLNDTYHSIQRGRGRRVKKQKKGHLMIKVKI
jgi:hypothetical protein